jgi:hypothetical protein
MRLFVAAAVLVLPIAGSASAETREASGFSAISASSGIPVNVIVGPEFRGEVLGRDAHRVMTEVRGERLIVGAVRQGHWGRRDARVSVTMPRVSGLDAFSGAHIRASRVSGGDLELGASSGAGVQVSGVCGALSAESSSGARIDASALQCRNGKVDASSGSNAAVHISGRLDVEASSGAGVIAGGGPELGDISLSSGGSLRRAD